MKEFKGRVVTPGTCTAEAVVTKQGFNTLASMQTALQFGDKKTKCGDQNNPDINGLPLCANAMGRQPACMLFANHIDSLAAAGAVLADVWVEGSTMPVVDCLGDEFLDYVKTGMTVTVKEGGIVTVE